MGKCLSRGSDWVNALEINMLASSKAYPYALLNARLARKGYSVQTGILENGVPSLQDLCLYKLTWMKDFKKTPTDILRSKHCVISNFASSKLLRIPQDQKSLASLTITIFMPSVYKFYVSRDVYDHKVRVFEVTSDNGYGSIEIIAVEEVRMHRDFCDMYRVYLHCAIPLTASILRTVLDNVYEEGLLADYLFTPSMQYVQLHRGTHTLVQVQTEITCCFLLQKEALFFKMPELTNGTGLHILADLIYLDASVKSNICDRLSEHLATPLKKVRDNFAVIVSRDETENTFENIQIYKQLFTESSFLKNSRI
jgi:hypothetical protein